MGKTLTKQQERRQHHGGAGSGSRSVTASSYVPVDITNKPTLADIESILRVEGEYTKYEGTPAPDLSATTWKNDSTKDTLHILMPPGKDYETLVKIRTYLTEIFGETRDALVSRSTDGVLREFPAISIHFNAGTTPDKMTELTVESGKTITLEEYDESIHRAEAKVREAKKLLTKLTPQPSA